MALVAFPFAEGTETLEGARASAEEPNLRLARGSGRGHGPLGPGAQVLLARGGLSHTLTRTPRG